MCKSCDALSHTVGTDASVHIESQVYQHTDEANGNTAALTLDTDYGTTVDSSTVPGYTHNELASCIWTDSVRVILALR